MSGSNRAQALARQYQYISKNPQRFFNCTYDGHKLELKETKWGFKWECPVCHASVGCHKGTTQPLGTVARESLRMARMEAHDMFDKVWKTSGRGLMSAKNRKRIYAMLAIKMGLTEDECHFGMFTIEQCRKAISILDHHYHTKLCPLKDLL